MAQTDSNLSPTLSDNRAVKEIFYAMPLLERGKPLFTELQWVLLERPHLESHKKILPDYCYNIFDVFKKTYFKNFPLFSESVLVTDPAGLKSAKTAEQAKKVIRIDWKNIGRLFGIAAQCIRFAEMESANDLAGSDFNDLTPAKVEELFTVIFGRSWVAQNQTMLASEPVDQIFAKMLNQYLASWINDLKDINPTFENLAWHWGPAAMIAFSEGFAEGLTSFMDVDGQLVGQSDRAGLYGFLLVVWPEIEAMLEASPKKTLPDLHEWMKPFMRVGITTYIGIETLRDVCEPPPRGIGLSLRPLKVRPLK